MMILMTFQIGKTKMTTNETLRGRPITGMRKPMNAIIALPGPMGGMVETTPEEANILVRDRIIRLGMCGVYYLCGSSTERDIEAYLEVFRKPKVAA